jgi:hypothetical protein
MQKPKSKNLGVYYFLNPILLFSNTPTLVGSTSKQSHPATAGLTTPKGRGFLNPIKAPV